MNESSIVIIDSHSMKILKELMFIEIFKNIELDSDQVVRVTHFFSPKQNPISQGIPVKNAPKKKIYLSGYLKQEEAETPFIFSLCLNTGEILAFKTLGSKKKPTDVNNKITTINYGPYDNSYLLIGMETGTLLMCDPISLSKIA